MRTRLSVIASLSVALLIAGAAIASADAMLGSTADPSGSAASGCGSGVNAEPTSPASTPYTAPTAGTITQWQVNTATATASAPVSLVVLRPTSPPSYSVVGVDTEQLPNPLPAGGIASFTVASPIAVQAGDVLGLYSTGPVACYFDGGTTPSGNELISLPSASTPTAGQTLTSSGASPAGYELNLEVTEATPTDVAVTTAFAPASPAVGSLAALSATVSNAGPAAATVTFTDGVPAGLTIDSALAGSGTCTIAGQTVTCMIDGLASGASSPVMIVVTPTATGTYTNTVTVSPAGSTDPHPANNTSSATFSVAAALVAPHCTVPTLRGLTLSVARRLLGELGCTTGTVTRAHSKLAKGLVVGTTPGPSTGAAGLSVSVTLSSGRSRRTRHRR